MSTLDAAGATDAFGPNSLVPPAPPAPPAPNGGLARVLPWVSLATALGSALWMERDTTRASLVGAGALLGWLVVLGAAVVVRRMDARESDGQFTKRHRAARFVAVLVSQTALQQALLFPLPFFLRATVLTSSSSSSWMSWFHPPAAVHVPFLVAYACALVVVVWDPAWAFFLRRPALGMTVQAVSAYVAAMVALPMLGLSLAQTATIAGVVVGVALGAQALWGAERSWSRRAVLIVLAVVLAFCAGRAVRFVPPAPLSLSQATFAVDVVQREPVGAAAHFRAPDGLWCHTAVRAPLGLSDRLVHVWRREGVEVARIPLEVTGGTRAEGFRTWSRLRAVAAGRWECRVETSMGQVIGVVFAQVHHAP
jgi:hypothetical protein